MTSPRVALLSERAEIAFIRLILKVDDGGVYYADPLLVRAAIWPTKSLRTTDVSRVLDELGRAGLIARWTHGDGGPLPVPAALSATVDVRHPPPLSEPPFDPDSGEALLGSGRTRRPEQEAPPARKKKKRREGGGARGAAPAPAPRGYADAAGAAPETTEQWLARLAREWPGVDVRAEADKAARRKEREGGRLERVWFERHWLPGCSDTVDRAELRKAGRQAEPEQADAPDGWREAIADTNYGPGGAFEVQTWAELPEHVKKEFVRGKGACGMTVPTPEELLAAACEQVGMGVRTAQGRARDAESARKRAIVAEILIQHGGLGQSEVARLLGRTDRAVRKMVQEGARKSQLVPVSSGFRGPLALVCAGVVSVYRAWPSAKQTNRNRDLSNWCCRALRAVCIGRSIGCAHGPGVADGETAGICAALSGDGSRDGIGSQGGILPTRRATAQSVRKCQR